MPREGPAVKEGPEQTTPGPEQTNPVSSDNSQVGLLASTENLPPFDEKKSEKKKQKYVEKSVPLNLVDPCWEDEYDHPDNVNARKYAATRSA